MIYFDSCYLSKLYLAEPDSAAVRARAAAAGVVACSHHGRVEVASVLHRKFREGLLSQSALEKLIAQIDQDTSAGLWRWLPVSDALILQAVEKFSLLPDSVFLRAGDALHLACAAMHGFTEIYSSDKHLLAAAPRFGLKGIKL